MEKTKYVKIPVEVYAMQMTDENFDDLVEFANHLVRWDRETESYYVFDYLHNTWVQFEIEDWIIEGVKGEFYPCAAEVFAETYKPAPTGKRSLPWSGATVTGGNGVMLVNGDEQ